ncbi:MAG TPA: peptidoglycan bridge formation glycyltransferase FemA/FemB family protein [Candidatus Limnocylindria bacterium]
MSSRPTDNGGLTAWQETDPTAWDAFVETAEHRAFPQLWAWGELRVDAGWRPIRLLVGPDPARPRAGVQLLLRRVPLGGWSLAYAPRGPVGELDDPAVREALIAGLHALGAAERIGRVRADPETTASEPYGAALLTAPWREAPKVQPPTTRLVDLTRPHEELWSDLGRKHRQYVSKAGREGVTIEPIAADADPSAVAAAVADFDRIYRDTGTRAGFAVRVPAYYRRVWEAFAAAGRARLSFAVRDGERVAVLFHLLCGDRVAEVYGGMTETGAASRANYLLKWEAIRALQAEGLRTYDLWGLATGGIRKFKEGFGGTEVTWVGARDLGLGRTGDAIVGLALAAHGTRTRVRHGRRSSPGAEPGAAAD